MKIRNGFVSNSSSSSFVVLGVYGNKDFEKFLDENDECTIDGIDSLYIESSESDCIYGKIISDNEEIEETETNFEELNKMAQEISEKLGVDISEVKLITGFRPC